MLPSIFKSICAVAALLVSPTAAIKNWTIDFQDLSTDFQHNVDNEITLEYYIGAGLDWNFTLFDVVGEECADTLPNISIVSTNATNPNVTDNKDEVKIMLDFNKTLLTTSNIWDGSNIKFCAVFELLSGEEVMERDERRVTINFDFKQNFNLTDINTTAPDYSPPDGPLSLTSNIANNFIDVCKCDGFVNWECNGADSLGPDNKLYVCVKSKSPDVQIAFVKDILISQEDTNESLQVKDGNILQNPDISFESDPIEDKTLQGVATVVPLRFFETIDPTITVTGEVQVNFIGQRSRRLDVFNYAAHHVSVISTRATRGDTIPRLRSFGSLHSTPSELEDSRYHSDASRDAYADGDAEESYDPYLGIELEESMSMSMSMPGSPTTTPSKISSTSPSKYPSELLTMQPTNGSPTTQPTQIPSKQPSVSPTSHPRKGPTKQPSTSPTTHSTKSPSKQPSVSPTVQLSDGPSKQPSASPSKQQPVHSGSNESTEKKIMSTRVSRSMSNFGFKVGLTQAKKISGLTAERITPVATEVKLSPSINSSTKQVGTAPFLGTIAVLLGGFFW